MDYNLDHWKMVLAPSAIIVCILWDIVFYVAKDWLNVKISSRVPRNLFVLSALTIQILSYVDIQKVDVFGPCSEIALEVLVENQLRMDLARLTMCVFVGCLMTGMAIVGSVGGWSNVAALFLSLSFHIAIEIYALQNFNNSEVKSEAGPWFMTSGVLLVLGTSSLLFLLGEVTLCGNYLRHVICPDDIDVENHGDKWKILRSEVKKSWVAARAWKTRYFIASSMFSPGAGVIVTICVAVMAVKVGLRSFLLHHNNGGNLTFFLQCIFILVGWILMLLRWFKAALYCSTVKGIKDFMRIVKIFFVPTASVVYILSPRFAYIFLHPDFSIREFKFWDILISLSCVVPLLPLCVLIFPIGLLLLFCYICWYFSKRVLGSQFVQHLCKLDKKADSVKDAFEEYKSMLEGLGVEENDRRTFWMVNEKSFNRIKGRMDESNKKAQSCTVLLSLMGNSKMDENQRFRKERSKSWMRGIVIIFTEIVSLDISMDMKDAFQAYMETQDVLKFVDCPNNIIVDPLNIFGTLNIKGFRRTIDCEVKMLKMERESKKGLRTSEKNPDDGEREERNLSLTPQEQNTVDALVEKITEYFPTESSTVLIRLKRCRSTTELGILLRTLVAHAIVSCLLDASDVIVKYTRQWDDRKIEGVVELAGKVNGLLDKLVEGASIR